MEDVEKLASSFVDDALVSIELEDGGRFKVQSALLIHASDYFRGALTSGFREGENKVLRLPGCSTDVFKLILFWICNGKLPDLDTTVSNALDAGESYRSAEAHAIQLNLTQLWLVGDMLLMSQAQNDAMRCLRRILEISTVSTAAMSLAFESVSPESPLRRALLQVACRDFLWPFHGYTYSDLDAFGLIPGFMAAFLESMPRCTAVPSAVDCERRNHAVFHIDADAE